MATKKLTKHNLNPQQILFCEHYIEPEIFMNGTKAYHKAYPDCDVESARRLASSLLTNIDILNYIDSMIDPSRLDIDRRDREYKKLALQDEDKGVKLNTLKHLDALEARIEKGKQKALTDGEITKTVLGLPDDELNDLAFGDD